MKKHSLLLACALIALAGCHSSKADRQLVATGKDFEISVPEFDQLLRAAPMMPKDQVAAARRKILNGLVTQKLFADAAIDQKLDRDVDTMQQIEALRRRVLAAAYLDRLTSSAAKPTSRDISVYYDAHPWMFAERKVFTINQVEVTGEHSPIIEYRAALDRGGMAGLDARLAQDGIAARSTNVVIPGDSLPRTAAEQLAKLPAGSPVAFAIGNTLHLGVLTAVQDGTLELDEARPSIEAMLLGERRVALLQSQAERLRSERNITVKDVATLQANKT
ncbi:EpsD family peptidyl-prolyl cis-trans isomerase [Sphingomonas bacterium]|uniref:EpsD family peptidyl-prolyl cis-trans isomerase n=1 Tax=Sphingomonas bacterium TaxID=1895847 RepID=UPI001576B7B9|nr:EpsD family peptidyl-prolyl cis-trans isomerase [Sphingomonas bacterium]